MYFVFEGNSKDCHQHVIQAPTTPNPKRRKKLKTEYAHCICRQLKDEVVVSISKTPSNIYYEMISLDLIKILNTYGLRLKEKTNIQKFFFVSLQPNFTDQLKLERLGENGEGYCHSNNKLVWQLYFNWRSKHRSLMIQHPEIHTKNF